MAGSKGDQRKRVYSLVTLGTVCVVGLVAMGGMLAKGRDELGRKVYAFPHRTLFHLAKAENRFRRLDRDADGVYDYAASLADLEKAGVITSKLGKGRLGDYTYKVLHADENTWSATATPAEVTSSSLFYFVDETHVVRSNNGAPADAESEVYWSPHEEGWSR